MSALVTDYGLDLYPREKPVLHVDDLHTLLFHHWALDTEVFPDERQRVQLAAIMLTAAYTAARPGSLVYVDTHDQQRGRLGSTDGDVKEPVKTLCYKHIALLLLRDDGQGRRGTRNTMVMEIDLTHVKGNLRDPKP